MFVEIAFIFTSADFHVKSQLKYDFYYTAHVLLVPLQRVILLSLTFPHLKNSTTVGVKVGIIFDKYRESRYYGAQIAIL